MATNLVFPIIGQHLAVLLAIVPTGKIKMIKLQVKGEFSRRCFHHPKTFGHDFFANAIARNNRYSFSAHEKSHFTWLAPEFQATPFASNKSLTRQSSRPQSRS